VVLTCDIDEALQSFHRTLALPRPDAFDLRDHQHFLGNEPLMSIWSMTGDDSEVWGSVIHPGTLA
jgi:hypothetical protein